MIAAGLGALALSATADAKLVPAPGSSGGVSTVPPSPPPASAPVSCADYKWTSPPRLVMHVSEFADDGGSFGDGLKMLAAAADVVDAFNDMGGTSAAISNVETTTDPFNWGAPASDPVPTIHFGWTNDIRSLNNGNPAGALAKPIRMSNCTISTAYIVFPDSADPGNMEWDYGTPANTSGSQWFAAGPTDDDGKTWFRPSFLHELLHAFDFHHLQGEYTFMTHRSPAGFPWVNAAKHDQVLRPLPYEIAELRRLYPASDTKYDVALTNTWYGPPTDPDDAAGGQYQLCLPSLGENIFPMRHWSGTCGVDPGAGFGTSGSTTSVCPGTTLHTRFTIANSSTTDMTASATLYFSRDDTWDSGDRSSPDYHVVQLDEASSSLQELSWTVPDGIAFDYRPIVRIVAVHVRSDGTSEASSVRSDWIPLSGTVECQPVAIPR